MLLHARNPMVTIAGGLLFLSWPSVAWAGVEIAKLVPAGPNGNFGQSVSVTDDHVFVGAPAGNGAVYVFQRVAFDTFIETQIVLGFSHAALGTSVDAEGVRFVAGAVFFPTVWNGAGFASVYRLDAGSWLWEADLVGSISEVNDQFGISVSMSGDLIAVGSPSGQSGFGSVFIFTRQGMNWTEEARLTPSGRVTADIFGWSVSLKGELLVVGAIGDDSVCPGDLLCFSGAAYVFRLEGANWVEQQKLVASDAARGYWFGTSVSTDGTTVVVSAPNQRKVYVFEQSGSTWQEQTKLRPPEGAGFVSFGGSVSIEGDLILVSAACEVEDGRFSGAAQLFRNTDSTWIELNKLVASDSNSSVQTGSADFQGDLAVIGSGEAAYVFDLGVNIPGVSTWGNLVMSFILLCVGFVVLARRRRERW